MIDWFTHSSRWHCLLYSFHCELYEYICLEKLMIKYDKTYFSIILCLICPFCNIFNILRVMLYLSMMWFYIYQWCLILDLLTNAVKYVFMRMAKMAKPIFGAVSSLIYKAGSCNTQVTFKTFCYDLNQWVWNLIA